MENFFKCLIVLIAIVVSLICIALNATNKEIHNLQQKVETLENITYTQGGIEQ